jgi:hypothetical protein
VQDVYRLQGVKINDKHIEVIVRQMLRRVQVVNPGDSHYIAGEQVERSDAVCRRPIPTCWYPKRRCPPTRSSRPRRSETTRSDRGRDHGQATSCVAEGEHMSGLIPAGWRSRRAVEEDRLSAEQSPCRGEELAAAWRS